MNSKDTYHRPAPAYQEYAATMLSRIEYRLMTQMECGLLHKMKLECWHNKNKVPSDPNKLAKILGFNLDDLKASLPNVMWHFAVMDDLVVCPELEAYQAELDERLRRMSVGGAKGAEKTNASRRVKRNSTDIEDDSPTPAGYVRGLSTEQENIEKQNQNQSIGKETTSEVCLSPEQQKWVDDYNSVLDTF